MRTFSLISLLAFGGAAVSANVDLRPYYSFLTKDGFTATYAGTMERDGVVREAEWIYRVKLLGQDGGRTQSELEIIIDFADLSEGVAGQMSIKTFYSIADNGVFYTGDRVESSFAAAPGMQITNLVETEVLNESMFLPRTHAVPGTFEWSWTERSTTTLIGSPFPFPPMVDEYTIESTTKFIGFETITVPAGTFNTLRVEIVESEGGEEIEVSTLWWAPDVGLVKVEEQSEEDEGMQLTSFELVRVESTAETPITRIIVGATPAGDLLYSPWLGLFDPLGDSGWVFHFGFGLLYPVAVVGDTGYWFYSTNGLEFFYIDSNFVSAGANGTPSGWLYTIINGGAWGYFFVDLSNNLLWITFDGATWLYLPYL